MPKECVPTPDVSRPAHKPIPAKPCTKTENDKPIARGKSPLIELRNVERYYEMGDEVVKALNDISFSVSEGEYLAIVGTSGSGKTTLMNLLGCLDSPTSGDYLIRGQNVRDLGDDALSELRNREIGFIFQSFQLLPRQSALANVELPLIYRGTSTKLRREAARRVLEEVGLGHRIHHKPTELSGGQRQRVAIARALVTHPSLLLADEPTGNLDSGTEREILALFEQLHQAGNSIVLVTHEPAIAAQCPRAIRLADGKVVADKSRPRNSGAKISASAIGASSAVDPTSC